jgi:hypothetical protein
MIGNDNSINDGINCIKAKKIRLETADDLNDYMSFIIMKHDEKKTTCVMQSHLINNLKETIENGVNNVIDYGTPRMPCFKIVRPKDKMEILIVINNQNTVLAWGCFYT